MKPYSVKELFYTLQGEGAQSGMPAIFCRFTKCNLWSGREEDREKAICKFCDTNFNNTDGENGGEYSQSQLIDTALSLLPPQINIKLTPILVVFTGGEPSLQITTDLVEAFKIAGFRTAIESNGTKELPINLDWITVSPKANTVIKQKSGSELKIVYPQNLNPKDFESLDFKHFYISPMTTPDLQETKKNIDLSVNFCLNFPKWKLSYQSHKIWGIP